MAQARPIVGITMGDPAGIGPEIAAKALAHDKIHQICRPLIIGDAGAMRQGTEVAGVGLCVRPVAQVEEATFQPDGMDVLDLRNVDAVHLKPGKVALTRHAHGYVVL